MTSVGVVHPAVRREGTRSAHPLGGPGCEAAGPVRREQGREAEDAGVADERSGPRRERRRARDPVHRVSAVAVARGDGAVRVRVVQRRPDVVEASDEVAVQASLTPSMESCPKPVEPVGFGWTTT